MRVRALLLTLFVAAALALCAARPAEAAPALWVVQSGSAKIYLFGTVHLLRDGTPWRSPELEAAIGQSQDLYLEIADPANVQNVLASLMKIGYDPAHPLSTKIPKADVALLDQAAKRYGFGGESAFEPMEPWLAFVVLSTLPAVHSGYSSGNGVDLQIRKEFVAAGKPVRGLETVDSQLHVFAGMPEATQVELLDAQLKNIGRQNGEDNLDAIVDAWLTGDQDDLATSMQMAKLQQSTIYARLFTDRNKAWAAALAQRLTQPGTSFVSVGAGHLVGPDGVPALLARMGYAVTRVSIAQTAAASSPAPASPAPASPAPAASEPAATPSPSPTPIPVTLTPPAGWKPRAISLHAGPFTADRMWVDPNRHGAIISGHLDLPDLGTLNLDTLDAIFHQGMVMGAGAKGAPPSTRVKICNGKQDGTYTRVALQSVKEDIVLAVSDRGYIAQYVREKDVPDDPSAAKALLTLCAP